MTDIAGTIDVARRALGGEGLAGALIGGFAVSVRAEPRFTRDVDLAVAVTDDTETESLLRRLLADGHEVLGTIEQHAVGRLATARVRLIGGDLLDLLFASSGIEPEVVSAAEPIEILPSVDVPVAVIGHLIALKLLSRTAERPNDNADLRALLGASTPGDLALAEQSVGLIEARGFGRRRDLRGALRAERAADTG